MKKELVKYHNDLSDLSLKNFNSNELDLFMTICHEVKERRTNKVVLPFSKIKSLSKLLHR